MVSIITLLLLISSLRAETQTLQLNSLIEDSINSYQMKYYSIELDKNLKDNDLLIDSRMTETKSFHAPLTTLSLVFIFNIRILYLMIIRKSNGYVDNLEKKFASFRINIYRLDKRYILALHVINANIA